MLEYNAPTVSSFCAADKPQCVEVTVKQGADGQPEFEVRDTKAGKHAPKLRFTAEEWLAFVEGVKAGEFDVLEVDEPVAAHKLEGGIDVLTETEIREEVVVSLN